MREILQEIKVLQSKRSGCVPNMQGASPVGRDRGGRSYAAQAVSSSGAEPGEVEKGG